VPLAVSEAPGDAEPEDPPPLGDCPGMPALGAPPPAVWPPESGPAAGAPEDELCPAEPVGPGFPALDGWSLPPGLGLDDDDEDGGCGQRSGCGSEDPLDPVWPELELDGDEDGGCGQRSGWGSADPSPVDDELPDGEDVVEGAEPGDPDGVLELLGVPEEPVLPGDCEPLGVLGLPPELLGLDEGLDEGLDDGEELPGGGGIDGIEDVETVADGQPASSAEAAARMHVRAVLLYRMNITPFAAHPGCG